MPRDTVIEGDVFDKIDSLIRGGEIQRCCIYLNFSGIRGQDKKILDMCEKINPDTLHNIIISFAHARVTTISGPLIKQLSSRFNFVTLTSRENFVTMGIDKKPEANDDELESEKNPIPFSPKYNKVPNKMGFQVPPPPSIGAPSGRATRDVNKKFHAIEPRPHIDKKPDLSK